MQYVRRLQLWIFSLLFFMPICFGAQGIQESDTLKAEQAELRQIAMTCDQLLQVYKTRLMATTQIVTHPEMMEAFVARDSAEAALNSAHIAVANVTESIHLSEMAIQKMKDEQQKAEIQLDKTKVMVLQGWLLTQQNILKYQRLRLEVLKNIVKLREKIADIHQHWCDQLLDLQQQQRHHRRIENLLKQMRLLQQEQNRLLQRVVPFGSESSNLQQSFYVYTGEERITLSRLSIFLLQLQIRAEDYFAKQSREAVVKDPLERDTLRTLAKKLSGLDVTVKTRMGYITKHLEWLHRAWVQKQVGDQDYKTLSHDLSRIKIEYVNYLERLNIFVSVTQQFEKKTRQQYKYELYQRESLPGLTWFGWKPLTSELFSTPELLLKYMSNTWSHLLVVTKNFAGFYAVFFLSLVGLTAAFFYLNRYLNHIIKYFGSISRRFSQDVLWVCFRLIKSNLLFFGLILLFSALGFFVDINLGLLIHLLLILMSARIAIYITHILLIDGISSMVVMSRVWYLRLRLFFIITAILSMGLLVVHVLPVTEAVQGLFNRIFMMVLLVLSIFLFRAWFALPNLLQHIFAVRRNYIMNAIRLFCRVLPITLFSNAIIGLLGYVQLAWLIGGIQGIALIVLFGYLVARGLIFDFIELCYEMTIRYLKNGWLWAQVVLKPLDKILRFGLLGVVVWILVMAYGLNENQKFMVFVYKFFMTPLINLGDNIINIAFLLKMIIFVAVLCWVGKWSREFAFRSLYARARDLGLRNSLAVFTQYAVVVFGVTATLKFLGVDLSGLAVVAAAFAAGIGFGLRDLFSNFFSGILLLVERPIRTGDLITIGSYEGQVLSTGMRSMKMRTWDHLEVIVPNSDIFTKPFVNWTLQDSIVRSVVTLRLDRVDDPHDVQTLIYEVLKTCRAVLEDPGPEVFLKELSESLIEMEVRYYINLQVDSSRSGVRSAVLFAIWDCFQKNNIRPPYPHLDLPVR